MPSRFIHFTWMLFRNEIETCTKNRIEIKSTLFLGQREKEPRTAQLCYGKNFELYQTSS